LRDENSSQSPRNSLGSSDTTFLENTMRTEPRGVRIEETLLCSRAGEVLYQWNCDSIEKRLDLFKKLEEQAVEASKGTPSGRFHRVSMDIGTSRIMVQIQPAYKLLVRSALPVSPPPNP